MTVICTLINEQGQHAGLKLEGRRVPPTFLMRGHKVFRLDPSWPVPKPDADTFATYNEMPKHYAHDISKLDLQPLDGPASEQPTQEEQAA